MASLEFEQGQHAALMLIETLWDESADPRRSFRAAVDRLGCDGLDLESSERADGFLETLQEFLKFLETGQ